MITNLFDFNNLAVRTWCTNEVGAKSVDGEPAFPNIQLWKYFLIDSLYTSLSKNGEDVNEVILAVDDRKSWRKLFWTRYKESRKGKRDKSGLDWDLFHSEYRKLTYEISEHLPFKILQVENAEADDIIGVLANKDDNKYVVISNDEDYLQLLSDRVKIYNPQKMSYMECDDVEKFVVTKCLTGQPKDDIFNIKTPLDWPAGKRKPGFGEVSAQKVLDYGYEKWLNENNLMERFKVNRTLIDFKLIPQTIKTRILNEYNNYQLADPSNIYDFFKRNKFTGYLEDFSSVESKLLQLYN